MSRAAALDELVARLAAASIGRTFNQYRQSCGDDADPTVAPVVRTENLRAYLGIHADAEVVLLGEAAGWRGARHSGVALLSERQIEEMQGPYRRTSTHRNGWAEPSATIVRGVLRDGGWEAATLVWNTVQTHPYGASAHSNRLPLRPEIRAGREVLVDLLAIIRPRHVIALGRTAAAALPVGLKPVAVRHPAQGGATLCRAQLGEALRDRLG